MDLIVAKNVKKEFNQGWHTLRVLNNFNLTVKENEFVAIFGISFSGKSTCTNILSGLDSYFEGDVIINGINMYELNNDELIKFRNENIAVIFDTWRNLANEASAVENIQNSIFLSKNKEDARNRALKYLELLRYKGDPDAKIYELLVLDRYKAAVARALAMECSLLIADEPTNGFDEENSKYFFNLLAGLRKKRNMTIVMFTQVKEEAALADRILYFKDGKLSEVEG